MNKETIVKNEVENDGKTIHLYFNKDIGMYVAYGFSAFFATHIVDVITSFSEDFEMPVALIRKSDLEELRLSTVKQQHNHRQYYKLELMHPISLNDYVRWGNNVKSQYNS